MRSQEVKPMTVLNKVWILKSECHPCIINLKNVIDKLNFLFIVMEGEHFYKIIDKTERSKAPFFKDCLCNFHIPAMKEQADNEEEQDMPTWRGGGGGRGEKAEVGGTNGAAGEPSIQSLHILWSRGTGRWLSQQYKNLHIFSECSNTQQNWGNQEVEPVGPQVVQ